MRKLSLQEVLMGFSFAILANFIWRAESDISSAIMIASTMGLIAVLTFIKERDQQWKDAIIKDVETKINEQRLVIIEQGKVIDQLRALSNTMSARLEIKSSVGQKEAIEQAIIRRF